MKIAIVDYNAGNIFSVDYAMKRLGIDARVTNDKDWIAAADGVVFPGQGEAETTMRYLHESGLGGLIKGLKQPVLGICIGMQLLCAHSEEGDVDCLGVFDAQVRRFAPALQADKVPHMGWNNFTSVSGDLFRGISAEEYVYFVHSYYVEPSPYAAATTDYILPFTSAMQRDNFFAAQFHPEKSGAVGERLLNNFLDICRQ